MAMPNPKQGLQAKARIEIQQAIQLLKKNLNPEVFDVHGAEWKSLDSAIRQLTKVAGQEEGKDLSQAGLRMVASSLTPKGLPGVMAGAGGPPSGQGMTPPMPGPMPMGQF